MRSSYAYRCFVRKLGGLQVRGNGVPRHSASREHAQLSNTSPAMDPALESPRARPAIARTRRLGLRGVAAPGTSYLKKEEDPPAPFARRKARCPTREETLNRRAAEAHARSARSCAWSAAAASARRRLGRCHDEAVPPTQRLRGMRRWPSPSLRPRPYDIAAVLVLTSHHPPALHGVRAGARLEAPRTARGRRGCFAQAVGSLAGARGAAAGSPRCRNVVFCMVSMNRPLLIRRSGA